VFWYRRWGVQCEIRGEEYGGGDGCEWKEERHRCEYDRKICEASGTTHIAMFYLRNVGYSYYMRLFRAP